MKWFTRTLAVSRPWGKRTTKFPTAFEDLLNIHKFVYWGNRKYFWYIFLFSFLKVLLFICVILKWHFALVYFYFRFYFVLSVLYIYIYILSINFMCRYRFFWTYWYYWRGAACFGRVYSCIYDERLALKLPMNIEETRSNWRSY